MCDYIIININFSNSVWQDLSRRRVRHHRLHEKQLAPQLNPQLGLNSPHDFPSHFMSSNTQGSAMALSQHDITTHFMSAQNQQAATSGVLLGHDRQPFSAPFLTPLSPANPPVFDDPPEEVITSK